MAEQPGALKEQFEAGLIERDDLAGLIHEAWLAREIPLERPGERAWVGLFKMVGYIGRDAVRGVTIPPPTEPIEVFRGVAQYPDDRPRTGRGMSWTLDLGKARWFASRWKLAGCVYVATVPPKAVLAQFATSVESEVVVNPNMLRCRIELFEERAKSVSSAEQ